MRGGLVSVRRIGGAVIVSLAITVTVFKAGLLNLLLPDVLASRLMPDFVEISALRAREVIFLHLLGWALVAEGRVSALQGFGSGSNAVISTHKISLQRTSSCGLAAEARSSGPRAKRYPG